MPKLVEPIYKEIGTLLMCYRHENGMSQKDAANILCLTRASIANIEAGRQRIMLHTVAAIAALMDMSTGTLIDKAVNRVKRKH